MHIPWLQLWGVAGPLFGIWFGHWLSLGAQRKQRLADHKKEDYQAVLSALSVAFVSLVRNRTNQPTDQVTLRKLDDDLQASVAVLHSRIFIAAELRNKKLADRWMALVKEFRSSNDIPDFTRKTDSLAEEIRELALITIR
jgi:hypothetical protein